VNDQVVPAGVEARPDVIEALGKLTRDGADLIARANAARAVGVLQGQAAIPDLLEAVRSKDSGLIYESLIALQKIRDPRAAPGIVFLLRDLDDKVQIAAIETTGILGNRDALPQLRDVHAHARSKEIQCAALTAIAMLPSEDSRPLFEHYLEGRDPLMRAAAAEGIGRLGRAGDLPRIEVLFQAENKMNPRLSLALAAVMLGDTELTEFSPLQYLINTLNSGAYRGVAEPFLVELARAPEVRERLHAAAASATREEKLAIARILARSGNRESIPTLEWLSQDPDTEIAVQAASALRLVRARP
jgi:HEAT repeat protein